MNLVYKQMKNACRQFEKLKIRKDLNNLFELEEATNSDEKALRIKTCEWDRFKNYVVDIYKEGIRVGRKRELIDIKKLINKTKE